MPDAPLDPNVLAVCRKMQERAAVGFAKYGVTTERPDLDTVAWLTHLQEELMDATVYAEVVLSRLRRSAEPDVDEKAASTTTGFAIIGDWYW